MSMGVFSAGLAAVAIRSDEISRVAQAPPPFDLTAPRVSAHFPSAFILPESISSRDLDLVVAMPDCSACSSAELRWENIKKASKSSVMLWFPNLTSKKKWKRINGEERIASEDGLQVPGWFWKSAPRSFRVSRARLVEESKPEGIVEILS